MLRFGWQARGGQNVGGPGHAHVSTWMAQPYLRTISRTGGFGEETLVLERRRSMQKRWVRGALFASAAAALATALHLGATPAARAAEPYKAPRTADGKADLNGIWQAVNTANWDLQ